LWSATAERVRPNASRQAPILLTIGLHAAANEKSRIAGTMARAEVRARVAAKVKRAGALRAAGVPGVG
jgi:hypothetical protein